MNVGFSLALHSKSTKLTCPIVWFKFKVINIRPPIWKHVLIILSECRLQDLFLKKRNNLSGRFLL